jgi:hypothetical protein
MEIRHRASHPRLAETGLPPATIDDAVQTAALRALCLAQILQTE